MHTAYQTIVQKLQSSHRAFSTASITCRRILTCLAGTLRHLLRSSRLRLLNLRFEMSALWCPLVHINIESGNYLRRTKNALITAHQFASLYLWIESHLTLVLCVRSTCKTLLVHTEEPFQRASQAFHIHTSCMSLPDMFQHGKTAQEHPEATGAGQVRLPT
jgi:hypothetical protein